VAVAKYKPQKEGAVDDPHALLAEAERQLAAGGPALLGELPRFAREQQLLVAKAGLAQAEGKPQQAFDHAVRVLVEYPSVEGGAAAAATGMLTALLDNKGVTVSDRSGLLLELENAGRALTGGADSAPRKICFCLDYSGSMGGGRIMAANRNMLLIYDDYVYDNDDVAFVVSCRRPPPPFPTSRS